VDAEFLAKLLAGLARKHYVPGAQLVLYRDGQTMAAETGYAHYETRSPVSRESSFPLGSVTKSFTATVVMQLVSDDDVDLDEPIGTYLPELGTARGRIGRLVSARHLLSHTAGLPSDVEPASVSAPTLRRYALGCGDLELIYRPGLAFSYSNAGFVLAGRLIEAVTGMSWWEAVESMLLGPLGIEPAFCADPRIPARQRPSVSGHSVNPARDKVIPVDVASPVFLAPVGGLACSASDLVTFGRMHIGAASGPLEADHLALMRQGVAGAAPFGLADGWGLGVARYRTERADWFGHDGTHRGTTCHLRFDPVRGTVLAVTTNASAAGLKLWEGVLRGLRDTGLDVGSYRTPQAAGNRRSDGPDCAGHYMNGGICYSVSRDDDGALRIDLGNGIPAEMTFYDGLVFSAKDEAGDDLPIIGRFVCDPDDNEIALMEIGGRVARRSSPAIAREGATRSFQGNVEVQSAT
jgi:CubicO group peptidase (beta-lactamase class C family)